MNKRQAKKEALKLAAYMLDMNILNLTGILEDYTDADHDKVLNEIKTIRESLVKRRKKLG